MKPADKSQPDINTRYRTILILWFAICMSVLMFLALTRLTLVAPTENPMLSLALIALGLSTTAVSFVLKQKVFAKSVATQRADLVQSGYVLAFALCESTALSGLLDHFVTGSRYSYFPFVVGGIGLLLHFPQKQNLVNASSYKPL
jgi:hypothetical protein